MRYTILGAGLAGLSCSFNLGHSNCEIFDQNNYLGGHIFTHEREGFFWDEGPHVSFTTNELVKSIFAAGASKKGGYFDFPVSVSNFYSGEWIPHPAQSNLHAIPEPKRSKFYQDFLEVRNKEVGVKEIATYAQWLDYAFGKSFARTLPAAYTRKYWTVDASELSCDWIGDRVYYPDVKTVTDGYNGKANESTHYITSVRYPNKGGFASFSSLLSEGVNFLGRKQAEFIDLTKKVIRFKDGSMHRYEVLINTIPLPEFVRLCNPPDDISFSAKKLLCSSVLLINVTADHDTICPHHWIYVYDEDMLSTRINCIEKLSENNSPKGKTGIQVEVYFSERKPYFGNGDEIAKKVCEELVQMKLINKVETVHTRYIKYANVIFNLERQSHQDKIFKWLEGYGLVREQDDLNPMTSWEEKKLKQLGDLIMAGRFGQWKYYWTDDCVLRGKYIADSLTIKGRVSS